MNNNKGLKGFTLVELLVTVGIVSVVLVGLMQMFVYCNVLAELGGNMTKVLSAASDKIEEMRNYNYDAIVTDYASGGAVGNTFDLSQPAGKGVVYIDSSNANLLNVTVVVTFLNRNQRIVGEDVNLNGVLDAGEDLDGNGQIDSRVKLMTMIAKK